MPKEYNRKGDNKVIHCPKTNTKTGECETSKKNPNSKKSDK